MENVSLEDIREAIATALHSVNAYELPAMCERLGMASGTSDESMNSKRKYVRTRISDYKRDQLIHLAIQIVEEIGNTDLSDFISELTTHAHQRVTDLTRRAVLNTLNNCGELFGQVPIFEGLDILKPNWDAIGPISGFEGTLRKDIQKHYVINNDFSNFEVLQYCGALACSQHRFFELVELVLHPRCREGDAQTTLASQLDQLLSADGFTAIIIGEISRRPVYGVRKISAGVNGTPKNLIFAAINSKPDLFLIDSINNDIGIRNDHDALIYDRIITENGLTWSTLSNWWRDLRGLEDQEKARQSLYSRLRQSVVQANSIGEYVLFDTYYREYGPIYRDRLPALSPQVYLHYDPKTAKQRGENRVLNRERMDFLLLLDHNVRIVIEVDGKHHYADGDRASTLKYAAMAAEDRRLRLLGYEVYRFGGHEFSDTIRSESGIIIGETSRKLAGEFFKGLFRKHHFI